MYVDGRNGKPSSRNRWTGCSTSWSATHGKLLLSAHYVYVSFNVVNFTWGRWGKRGPDFQRRRMWPLFGPLSNTKCDKMVQLNFLVKRSVEIVAVASWVYWTVLWSIQKTKTRTTFKVIHFHWPFIVNLRGPTNWRQIPPPPLPNFVRCSAAELSTTRCIPGPVSRHACRRCCGSHVITA